MRFWMLAALFLGGLLGGGGLATAEPLTVKICYNGPPHPGNNAVHAFVLNFQKFLEEGTAGRVTLELYPDSQLGSEEERMELLSRKGMNQPILNVASFAGVAPVFPEIYASSLPFLFDSYRAAHVFFDEGLWWKKAQEVFRERTGAVLLEAVEEGGFLAFTNSKREIRTPGDFEGLKFRGMDEGQIVLYKSFGASGTPIPWTELYLALRTGVVDGQMNPAMYILMGSLYEVQAYMTLANIQYSDQFLVANGDLFDALSPEDQSTLVAAAKRANEISRAEVEAADAAQVEQLREKGMQIYAPTREELAVFRERAQKPYLAWLEKNVGPEWLTLALDSAKAANDRAAGVCPLRN